MSLRDRIKARVKGLLGLSAPSRPAVDPAPAPAPKPVSPAVAAPAPAVAAPAVAAPAVAPVVAAPADPDAAPDAAPDAGWQEIGRSDQVREGRAGSFGLSGTETVVAVFRKDGRLYAMDNACAHEDGPVGEGAVSGTRVRCPYHDWEYDFTTGACLTDPERRQTCWAVRERDGKILLGPITQQGTAARGGDHNDGMEVITQ